MSNNTRRIIALAAMGGDFAPKATVAGAVKAVEEADISILMVVLYHLIDLNGGVAE